MDHLLIYQASHHQIQSMDQFFLESEHQTSPPHLTTSQPQQQPFQLAQPDDSQVQPAQPAFNFSPYTQQPVNNTADQPQYEFNQFQEDEASRRIREDQERIQNMLRQKNREWSEKSKRKDQGRRQLNEFFASKQEQNTERAARNVRNEADNKEERQKLNVDAEWKKVISNINVRQGQRKGTKDTNRMRQAIVNRRKDDSR